MRKYMNIINRLLFGAVALAALSCTGNFEAYNRNPDQPSTIDRDVWDYIKSMQYNVIPTVKNQYQIVENVSGGAYGRYFAYAKSTDAGWNTGMFAFYRIANDWANPPYEVPMTNIYSNWRAIKAELEEPEDDYRMALAQIIRVAAMQRVTDIQGPIPYRTMENNDDLTAPYQSQEAVYGFMLEDLDHAVNVLETYITLAGTDVVAEAASADYVYSGNLAKWIRFANSLKLRMAMHISYAAPDEAERIVKEALSGENGGVIESNADNAQIPTQNNPFRVVMYDYNGGDSRVSADITSYMNGYKDPRRAKYFTLSTFTGGIRNGYIGLRSGISIPSESLLYSNMVVDYTTPLMWMNAAEVAFLKAEASLRGWYGATGDAERWYEEGVRLSFEQWGLSGDYDAYIGDGVSLPESYEDPLGKESNTSEVSTVTVKWDTRGDFETNLEQIITQKWLAIYPEGFEAWCEFRRTGYPRLMPATNNRSGGIIPEGGYANRMPYPVEEYQENNEHINEAVSLLGGPDNMATRLWWDCKEK